MYINLFGISYSRLRDSVVNCIIPATHVQTAIFSEAACFFFFKNVIRMQFYTTVRSRLNLYKCKVVGIELMMTSLRRRTSLYLQ